MKQGLWMNIQPETNTESLLRKGTYGLRCKAYEPTSVCDDYAILGFFVQHCIYYSNPRWLKI